jgi:hypothetical protein
MRSRIAIGVLTVAAALAAVTPDARAFDDAQYPDWKGQWVRIGGGSFDPSKPGGRGQQPPLTDAYRAIWEANLVTEASGGQYYNPQARCLPGGMPRMMVAFEPMEVIVTPQVTYMQLSYLSELRRIYTDGRSVPKKRAPTFAGYSIGRWVDEDGDGRYDALLIETRGMRGPRNFEASGIPLHADNQTVVKERITLDKTNKDVMLNEMTTIDNALTKPWTITRKYRRASKAVWVEHHCGENQQIFVGGETNFLSADGHLMPTRKDQPPPDLRKFEQAQK